MAMLKTVVCSAIVNRPVRTRMPWWCGEGGLNTRPYPIRCLVDLPMRLSKGMFKL